MYATTISWIKRHISKMPEGRLFHTSELLGYGARGTVDQNLRRLWLRGYIIKVARAVWVKAVGLQEDKTPLPTVLEIARLKAAAFKKKIVSEVEQIAGRSFKFMCGGRTTSFLSCHGRVYLRQASMRKISLETSVVGPILLKMWNDRTHVGGSYRQECKNFSRQELEEVRSLSGMIPQWLSEAFNVDWRFRPQTAK